jgi:hypothetical protein
MPPQKIVGRAFQAIAVLLKIAQDIYKIFRQS